MTSFKTGHYNNVKPAGLLKYLIKSVEFVARSNLTNLNAELMLCHL